MIQIFSKEEIISYIQTNDVSECICISLGDPNTEISSEVSSKYHDHIRLEFLDLHEPDLKNNKTRLATTGDIQKIITFIKNYSQSNRNFHIHCNAGIGRSPAIGIITLHLLNYSDEDIIRMMREVRPKSLPNELVIKIADEILNTNLSKINQVIRENRIKTMRSEVLRKLGNYIKE